MRSADFAVFFRPHYCRLAIASLHNVSKLLKKSYYATLRTNQSQVHTVLNIRPNILIWNLIAIFHTL